MLKWGWMFCGVIVLAGAKADELDKIRLQERCFVWQPQRCQKKHRLADETLVKSVTKGFSRVQASEIIAKRAWNWIRKGSVAC